MHSTGSPAPKPKRYYVSVTQQLAENSQTVRGVIKNNKSSHKTETEDTNQPQNRTNPNTIPNTNTSLASSSIPINNDSFYDDDDDLSDNRLYPSCYNRQKIYVAPLGKPSASPKQQPASPGTKSHNPK